MTRISIPSSHSSGPSRDTPAASIKSSTTTSVVAATPDTDDASVVGEDSIDPDVALQSIEYAAQPPSLVSLNSFNEDFTLRCPSPFAPSISFTPPPSSSDSVAFTPRSSVAPGQSTEVNGGMGELRLSEPATPRAIAQQSPVQPDGDDARPSEAFNLISMQAALNEGASQAPATPRPSIERQHLSPTPAPATDGVSSSRRRSSSALKQPRHEVCDEEPPTNRFHQPEFQNAFRDAKQLIADLSAVLATGSLHKEPDTTMKKLYEDSVALSSFRCPETRTIGFVGASGVGKSSLINSLLDIERLAKTSNGGEACTCVVVQYCYGLDPGFSLEVEYFTKEELQDQLSELLESYRHYHLSFNDLDEEEKPVFKDRARVAEDTFRAMFRTQLPDDIKESFLLTFKNEQAALRKLMAWVDNKPHSITVKESWADADSCSGRLNQLNEPALWPFIRKIRVLCNAHILSKGLILVDLPGLRDINSARRRVTERYILNCDEIFAVCNIHRAITDEDVMTVVELAKKASLSKLGIICTNSDDIDADEARNDWKGQRADIVKGKLELVKDAKQNVHDIEEDLKEYDIGPDDLLEEEKDACIRLGRRKAAAEKLVAQREFELKTYLVTTRNAIVRQKLGDEYADKIPGDDLAVFCVSNKDYWKARNLPRDVSRALLELSGILEVRKHCISIVADSQLRAATLYMEQKIPALLDSLHLWVQSGCGTLSAERKKAIRDTLDIAEHRLRRGLNPLDSELNDRRIKALMQAFLLEYQRKNTWARGAEEAAERWSAWSHGSFAAFCRKFGNHSTRGVGTHNWNEEAIESMVSDLSPRWRELCRQLERQGENAIEVVDNVLNETVDILVSEQELDDDQTHALANTILHRSSIFKSELETSYEEVLMKLAQLEVDALSGILTSFISQALNASYRACNRESGSGSDSRRKAIISRRLRGEAIFTEMEIQLKGRFRAIVDEFRAQQAERTRAHFLAIKQDFDMLRNENVILESESDPGFRARVEEELRRVKTELERVVATFAVV